jgi:hypothetical protein
MKKIYDDEISIKVVILKIKVIRKNKMLKNMFSKKQEVIDLLT